MRFPAEPLSNQVNKIEHILGFEKNELIILKIVVFQEFRGFLDFERNFDFDVSTDKQRVVTRASQIWPAGLITGPKASFWCVIRLGMKIFNLYPK